MIRITAALLIALSMLTACQSDIGFVAPSGKIERRPTVQSAEAHLQQARSEFEVGDYEIALERVKRVYRLPGLGTKVRLQAEAQAEQIALAYIRQLTEQGAPSKQLKAVYKLDLPSRVRVSAAIATAKRMLEEDSRIYAYRMIRDLDAKFPSHHERNAASKVVATAGFSMAADDSRYKLFFSYKARAPEVLEYLVLNYPSHPRCDEAYNLLANIYEGQERYQLALERHEDLLLYHPESALAPNSQARIPELRLQRIPSPDHNRAAQLVARAELESWLKRYPNGEQGERVRAVLEVCISNLIQSDLNIAKFYARIGHASGVRLHAERALIQAVDRGSSEQAEQARQLLESLEPPAGPQAANDAPVTQASRDSALKLAGFPINALRAQRGVRSPNSEGLCS